MCLATLRLPSGLHASSDRCWRRARCAPPAGRSPALAAQPHRCLARRARPGAAAAAGPRPWGGAGGGAGPGQAAGRPALRRCLPAGAGGGGAERPADPVGPAAHAAAGGGHGGEACCAAPAADVAPRCGARCGTPAAHPPVPPRLGPEVCCPSQLRARRPHPMLSLLSACPPCRLVQAVLLDLVWLLRQGDPFGSGVAAAALAQVPHAPACSAAPRRALWLLSECGKASNMPVHVLPAC